MVSRTGTGKQKTAPDEVLKLISVLIKPPAQIKDAYTKRQVYMYQIHFHLFHCGANDDLLLWKLIKLNAYMNTTIDQGTACKNAQNIVAQIVTYT